MACSGIFFFGFASGTVLAEGSAFAQPKAKKDPKAEALELFNKSVELYQRGKFDEAAKLLEHAYELHPEPVLLYNLGRAYEGLGQNEKAIDAYERYLKQAPDAKDRGALERRLETMKAQLEREKRLEAEKNQPPPVEQPKPEKPAPAPQPSTSPSPWPWVVTGVGVAVIGAGLFVGVQAKSKRSDAQSNPVNRDAADQLDSAKSMASTANILLIAGSVVTAGGVTWALLSRKKEQPAEQSRLHLTLTPAGFRLGGTL